MKWIYCVCLIRLLSSCSTQNDKESKEIACNKFVLLPEVGNLIKNRFNTNDSIYFDSQDQCFFLSYVRDRYKDTVAETSFRVVDSVFICNDLCSYIMFNYSIIRNNKTSEYFYYGLVDVHELSFSDTLEGGKIYEFQNKGLDDLISKLPAKNTTNENVFECIYNLYYSTFEAHKSLDRPVFDGTNSLQQIFSNFSSETNKSILQQEFIGRNESDFLTVESYHLGIIIFRIDRSREGKIRVKEFLLPPLKRIKHYRSDSYPSDCD